METPHLDRLAAESVVFDEHFGESFSAADMGRAWWTGRFEHRPPHSVRVPPFDLPGCLQQAGVRTTLLVEAGDTPDNRVAPGFADIRTIRGQDGEQVLEREMPFARLVQSACDLLHDFLRPDATSSVLWLWSRGVPMPWMPPSEFADLYFSELGLEPDNFTDEDLDKPFDPASLDAANLDSDEDLDELEYEDDDDADADDDESDNQDDDAGDEDELELDPEVDPREVEKRLKERDVELAEADLAWQAAEAAEENRAHQEVRSEVDLETQYLRALYAAYVTYLDRWVGKLLTELHKHPRGHEVQIILTAAAGESLGEHGPCGDPDVGLFEEVIHTPCLIRTNSPEHAGTRRSPLVQTVDFIPTLLDLLGITPPAGCLEGKSLLPLVRDEVDTLREAAFVGLDDQVYGIRTPEFYYMRLPTPSDDDLDEAPASEPLFRLFQKPHDRFDMSDMRTQFPAIEEDLRTRLEAWRSSQTPADVK